MNFFHHFYLLFVALMLHCCLGLTINNILFGNWPVLRHEISFEMLRLNDSKKLGPYFKFSHFFSANHHASWSKQKIEKSEQCVIVCNQAYNLIIIRHKSCVSNPLGIELVVILGLKSFRLTSSNLKLFSINITCFNVKDFQFLTCSSFKSLNKVHSTQLHHKKVELYKRKCGDFFPLHLLH